MSFLRAMFLLDVFRFEIYLTLSTFYAAAILTFWPAYVFYCTGGHSHLGKLAGVPYIGVGLFVACGLSMAGIGVRLTNRNIQVSTPLRIAALVVFGFFWFVSGLSLLLDSWRTPTCLMMMALGLWCPWGILKISLIEPRRI